MIRFMGGPMMNKRMNLTPDVIRQGRFVAYVSPPRAVVKLDDIGAVSDVTFQTGYYKPSKNPEIWTWVGPSVSDPWKSYERRLKKWQRQMAKLYSEGIYANTVLPPRPTPPVRIV